jgi:hypothetical protein
VRVLGALALHEELADARRLLHRSRAPLATHVAVQLVVRVSRPAGLVSVSLAFGRWAVGSRGRCYKHISCAIF